jgi:hypothetical protein
VNRFAGADADADDRWRKPSDFRDLASQFTSVRHGKFLITLSEFFGENLSGYPGRSDLLL